jgi:hypothetical protein
MYIQTKVRLHNRAAKTALKYGSETRVLNKINDWKQLERSSSDHY